jgi:hypothetical protein
LNPPPPPPPPPPPMVPPPPPPLPSLPVLPPPPPLLLPVTPTLAPAPNYTPKRTRSATAAAAAAAAAASQQQLQQQQAVAAGLLPAVPLVPPLPFVAPPPLSLTLPPALPPPPLLPPPPTPSASLSLSLAPPSGAVSWSYSHPDESFRLRLDTEVDDQKLARLAARHHRFLIKQTAQAQAQQQLQLQRAASSSGGGGSGSGGPPPAAAAAAATPLVAATVPPPPHLMHYDFTLSSFHALIDTRTLPGVRPLFSPPPTTGSGDHTEVIDTSTADAIASCTDLQALSEQLHAQIAANVALSHNIKHSILTLQYRQARALSLSEEERYTRQYTAYREKVLAEREAKRGTPGFFTSHEDSELEIVCNVCNDGDDEPHNKILLCDGCDIAVVRLRSLTLTHSSLLSSTSLSLFLCFNECWLFLFVCCQHQLCYGIHSIPEGQWFCERCEKKAQTAKCCVCSKRNGVFKVVQSRTGAIGGSGNGSSSSGPTAYRDSGWAHVLCCLYIPELYFVSGETMSPIAGVESIDKKRWKLLCEFCKKKTGACIQCHLPKW